MQMAQAKQGDKVKVNYTGKLEDGSVFDTSEGREPLEFTVGEGSLIPDFETAVEGMEIGDEKTVEIDAEKAYGPYREEGILEVPITEFPEHIKPEVGLQLQITQPDGQAAVVMISEVAEDKVTLDANHPLAGKDLTFTISLVEIL